MVEEFLVCSVCTRVGENRATSYHDSYINFPFFVSLSAKKEDLLLAMKLWHRHLMRVYLRLGRLTVSVMAWTN